MVPRHPPCALSSLSPLKKHTKMSTKLLQRCSRPLCSSQTTGGTTAQPSARHPPTPEPHEAVHALAGRYEATMAQTNTCHRTRKSGNRHRRIEDSIPQDPTVCRDPAPTPPRGSTPTTPDNIRRQRAVLTRDSREASHSRCSTSEHRPPQDTRLRSERNGRPPPETSSSQRPPMCSLERR